MLPPTNQGEHVVRLPAIATWFADAAPDGVATPPLRRVNLNDVHDGQYVLVSDKQYVQIKPSNMSHVLVDKLTDATSFEDFQSAAYYVTWFALPVGTEIQSASFTIPVHNHVRRGDTNVDDGLPYVELSHPSLRGWLIARDSAPHGRRFLSTLPPATSGVWVAPQDARRFDSEAEAIQYLRDHLNDDSTLSAISLTDAFKSYNLGKLA
jgi:hypothetical protein